MLSFEEFRASYEKIGKRSKPLTDEALILSYKKYCEKIEKQEKRISERYKAGMMKRKNLSRRFVTGMKIVF